MIQFEQETKTINGTEYRVTHMPYSVGHKVLLRLGRTVGAPLSELLSNLPNMKKGSDIMEADVASLGPALGSAIKGLTSQLSDKDFDYIVETLAGYSEISTESDKWLPFTKDMMDLHFAGNYLELFQWLGFALVVNFAGFSKEQDLIKLLLVKMEELKSRFPSGSTGTSIGSQARKNTPAP